MCIFFKIENSSSCNNNVLADTQKKEKQEKKVNMRKAQEDGSLS